MLPFIPETKDIVLIGGGHAHAVMLRMWGMNPLPGARLTLINPQSTAPYTGMLPGYVAGHYQRGALDLDMIKLARFAGARLILGKVCGLDLKAGLAKLEGRPSVAFDIASIDIGITSGALAPASLARHSVAAKPLGPFAAAWQAFVAHAQSGQAASRAVMIGGGIGGCELAMAMAHRLGKGAEITLIEQGEVLLPAENGHLRKRILSELKMAGVDIRLGTSVLEAGEGWLTLSDGQRLDAGFITAATGAHPFGWLEETGLILTDGFITIGETLQSVSHPNIFAVGDCAHMQFAPRPKAGVYAVRQGPILYENLRASLLDRPLIAYRPQADYLKLVSLGDKRATGSKWGVTLSGGWLWKRKNVIDIAFMKRLTELPQMPRAELPSEVAAGVREEMAGDPLCGGCGSKLAPDLLAGMLGEFPRAEHSALLIGPGDDACVTELADGRYQVLTTDHLRAFTLDPYLFARITAIHALGDIWAMGAAPDIALISITLPQMSDALARRTLGEIMAGLGELLTEAGAEIGGGHTAYGAELSIGLTLSGHRMQRPIDLGGAQPGDVLILTKPIGTGVLMAGEMRGIARGADVAAAYDSMQRSSADAAKALGEHAHAMTDVTGFGLAGHLMTIQRASGIGANLTLADIPVLDGAEDLSAAGIRSSLWPGNRAAADHVTASDKVRASPRFDLLFDPQTAGGLLAVVPPDVANDMPGQIIGSVTKGSGLSVSDPLRPVFVTP